MDVRYPEELDSHPAMSAVRHVQKALGVRNNACLRLRNSRFETLKGRGKVIGLSVLLGSSLAAVATRARSCRHVLLF